MRFGLFGSAQARRGLPDVDSGAGFREFVENNVEAEGLGYHSTFIVEHHFTGFGQISATMNLLTWVGARTTTLRLGTAVIVLAWHNPVLLAEQAATLDLLSGGRLDFGIGKGYRHNEFAGFATPMEEADGRFDESLEVMLKAWTSDQPWSHRGTYWRFDNVVVEPPTFQKPHPALWMGAGSPASIRKVAALGFKLLLDQYASIDQIRERIAIYKSEVEARGRVFDPDARGRDALDQPRRHAGRAGESEGEPRGGTPADRPAGPESRGRGAPRDAVGCRDLRLRALRLA